MRRINSLLLSIAFLITITLAGSVATNAQETMMKKVGDATKTVANKTVSGTKAGWRKGKRIGHTVGDKTWNGSKWVASKSWKGGKWVAVKTVNGTKWVYRKATGRSTTRRM